MEDETVGLPNLSRGLMEWMQSWEQITYFAERFIDAGDQVVVVGDWQGRGKASGVVSNWRHGAVWTLRDGKVISLVTYSDPAEALKAVGLQE